MSCIESITDTFVVNAQLSISPHPIGPADIQRHLDVSLPAQVVDGQEGLALGQFRTEVHNLLQCTVSIKLFQRVSHSINGRRVCDISFHLLVLCLDRLM